MGALYNDIGETMTLTNMKNTDERCELTFTRRGWFKAEKNKLSGKVFRYKEGAKKASPNYFEIKGTWSGEITLYDCGTK